MSIAPNTPLSAAKLKDLTYIVWGLLVVGFVLPFSIVIISSHRPPDADFAGFYSLGRILNEYSPRELYNYELQKRICEEVHPRSGEYGPLPYPPFVGLIFRPVTILPYWVAYSLWVLASIVFYGVGLRIAIGRFFPEERWARSLLYALAYAYFPFIGYTAGNGQLATVGFFAMALALREDDDGHKLRSGLALCLCLYKPTILLLILPMLLVTRRWRSLAGFAVGTSLVVTVTTLFEGPGVWSDFLRTVGSFGSSSVGIKKASFLPLAKYVDLSAFSSNVHGGRSAVGVCMFVTIAAAALATLIRFWWKQHTAGDPYKILLWATTLTWTLLINVYVPIYDSILVVLSLVLTAGILWTLPSPSMRRWFSVTSILILICSWLSVRLSQATGVQCMTLLFGSLGILQFVLLQRLRRPPVQLARER